MSIINADFGGWTQNVTRRFLGFLNLDVLRGTPSGRKSAGTRLFELERALREAAAAARPVRRIGEHPITITVDEAEHAALLRCRILVEKACAQMRTPAG